jgi:putative restriction endonuclease
LARPMKPIDRPPKRSSTIGMKAVFDTKPGSAYDDDVTRHYQFPRRYLGLVKEADGDWVILRRPRADGGNLAYFAVARVAGLEPDPRASTLTFARLSDYLEFDRPVAWRQEGHYAEQALREMPVKQVGVYLRGRSVRSLSNTDFAAIVSAGLSQTLAPDNAIRLGLAGLEEAASPFEFDVVPGLDQVRRVEQMLMNRKVRDANFRRHVCEAYEDRCAVTGLRIINGGGRSEVQAAHIWGVGEGGPDVVQNGIALSGTIHWLFDRHLISLTNDYKLLVSHNKVPAELRVLFERQLDRIHLPKDERLWPHPAYIGRHRERFMAA